jgi:alkylated DNA repair protein alkB family protein 8
MERVKTEMKKALIYVWAKEQQRGQEKLTYLLQQLPPKDGSRIKSDANETGSNLLPIHENRTNFKHSDVLVPWKLNPKTASLKDTSSREKYQRNWCVLIQKCAPSW